MTQKIAVIGASTAGLFAAEQLAKNGMQVTVYERDPVLSPLSRTYIITPGLMRVVPDLDPRLIRNRVDRIALEAGTVEAEIPLSLPDLILDRAELIPELARRAEEAGVEIRLGCEFAGFSSPAGEPELIFNSRQDGFSIKTDWLIGADGVNSAVRKNLKVDPLDTVPLLQAQVNLPDDWDIGVTKVWFKPGMTPYFYWLIPDRDRIGAVGLIAETGSNIEKLLDHLLAGMGMQIISYQSGVVSLHRRGLRSEFAVGNLPVSLIGDAAGQVKVTTVGGTVTGLVGARATVEGILEGTVYPKSRLSLNHELDLHLFIRKLLQKMTDQDYIDLLECLNPAVSTFLSVRDRDSMRRHFWKLPFLQPRFIPLGLRLLLRR